MILTDHHVLRTGNCALDDSRARARERSVLECKTESLCANRNPKMRRAQNQACRQRDESGLNNLRYSPTDIVTP
jgi:hypothetical protein